MRQERKCSVSFLTGEMQSCHPRWHNLSKHVLDDVTKTILKEAFFGGWGMFLRADAKPRHSSQQVPFYWSTSHLDPLRREIKSIWTLLDSNLVRLLRKQGLHPLHRGLLSSAAACFTFKFMKCRALSRAPSATKRRFEILNSDLFSNK